MSAEGDSGKSSVVGSGPRHAARTGREARALVAHNPLSLLVPGPPSHRKALPDFIRIPEEAMAVMLRRRNTGSSCQNTRGAVIMARLPDTGTRNYNAGVLPPVCYAGTALPPSQGGWLFPVSAHFGDGGAPPGEPRGLSLGN